MRSFLILPTFILAALALSTTTLRSDGDSAFFQSSTSTAFTTKEPSLEYSIYRSFKTSANTWAPFKYIANVFSPDKPDANPLYCLNGHDPKSLSKRERLLEFSKGPCSPVLLIPGHQATALRIEILDCELFRRENSKAFSICGWETCSGPGSKPASEYHLWVPPEGSFLNVLTRDPKQNLCFAHMLALHHTRYENGTVDFDSPKGTRVTWDGNTPETSAYSDCGTKSVRTLMKVIGVVPKATRDYEDAVELLEGMGYEPGYTLQSLPFNWMKSMSTNGVTEIFKRAVTFLYELTGKKVVVIGHSYGTMNGLRAFNKMTQESKDKMIKHFVGMSPTFSGMTETLNFIVGGNKHFILPMGLGIKMPAQKIVFEGQASIFDMFPSDPLAIFKGTPWVKEIRRILQKEEAKEEWRSSIFDFLPNTREICENHTNPDKKLCGLGILDLKGAPLVRVGNESYSYEIEDLKALVGNHSLKTKDIDASFEEREKGTTHGLENPGVPMSLLFYSHKGTSSSLTWNEAPRNKTFAGELYTPDKRTVVPGDGVVPKSCSLVAGLKWAYEYDAGKKGAKPVKLIEMCSRVNNDKGDAPIYDGKLANGEKVMKQNAYRGLECNCFKDGDHDGDDCDHVTILQDRQVLKYVKEIVQSEERISDFTKTLVYLSLIHI
eukprot:TRINITY_DN6302_c0_g1_i6.p1 TRINITY_DN6302_c0_g1~~TRINITY_DN6302_c0_g1_i6.p1  ORF type:complete len:662 (-),score=116.65 TRINITY_DN6302_c0_g1_i6:35-2020(-)